MEITTLNSLYKQLDKAELIGNGDTVITGIEYDSRKVKKGTLFVAVTGFKVDGNKFIPEAIKNGAAAIISEINMSIDKPLIVVPEIRQAMSDIAAIFYGYPGRDLNIIGVTGTNGKSASVYLIKTILETAGSKCGMINSLVYDTGIKEYRAERTTPESVDMQRLLSEMNKAGCTYGVVEVSSHALVLHRVENIDFKLGLYTNFSRDHLDFHRTMDEYLNAKKMFLNKLVGEDKSVALNMDVPEFASFSGNIKCRKIGYSVEGRPTDVMIDNVSLHPDRSQFILMTGAERQKITLSQPGRYNISNAVAAAAAALALGIDLATVARGLEAARAVPGRFEPVACGQPFSVIIDYAHTSDAIERLCLSAREITPGKLMILFGCGGDRDRGKRPLMGKAASSNSDFAIITSDNPRTEDMQSIIDDIKPGMQNDNYSVISDRGEAIVEILKRAEENDTILIAGKGAEEYQEIGARRIPFDDKTEIITALTNMGYKDKKVDKVGF